MIELVLIFGASIAIGYKLHHLRFHIQNQIDPGEIMKLAKEIRRVKNGYLAEMVDDLPNCPCCGPGIRHVNFYFA